MQKMKTELINQLAESIAPCPLATGLVVSFVSGLCALMFFAFCYMAAKRSPAEKKGALVFGSAGLFFVLGPLLFLYPCVAKALGR